MTLDFLRPARMDDVLEIVTEPEAVKGASIILPFKQVGEQRITLIRLLIYKDF